jgi:hypothetical protein
LEEKADFVSDALSPTKLNYNSAAHSASLPVTLAFADAVGEILMAIPEGKTPMPLLPFRYHIRVFRHRLNWPKAERRLRGRSRRKLSLLANATHLQIGLAKAGAQIAVPAFDVGTGETE